MPQGAMKAVLANNAGEHYESAGRERDRNMSRRDN
jgi:hypothetical protein